MGTQNNEKPQVLQLSPERKLRIFQRGHLSFCPVGYCSQDDGKHKMLQLSPEWKQKISLWQHFDLLAIDLKIIETPKFNRCP